MGLPAWRRARRVVPIATALCLLPAAVSWSQRPPGPSYPRGGVAGGRARPPAPRRPSNPRGGERPPVPRPHRGRGEVRPPLRQSLVATFNGGFKLQDAAEGFAVGGHTYAPMVNG